MRRFEEQYRLNEGDDVLNRENAIHQDVDLRLDAIELLGQAFAEGNRADIEVLIAAYRDTVSGLARQVQDLLGEAVGGISANAIAETADRLFLTAARRAAILSDLRGGVDASGDTLAKLLALIGGVIGGAPVGRQSLKALNDAISANTAALSAITGGSDPTLDSFAEALTRFVIDEGQISGLMTMVGNRLRGDAAGGYTAPQVAQFVANLGLTDRQPGVGDLVVTLGNVAPAGCLKLNGAALSRATYAGLWAWVQANTNLVTDAAFTAGSTAAFSQGDGSTTFRLPDLRGEFLRMWDDGRGLDAGRVIGSVQASNLPTHQHRMPTGFDSGYSYGWADIGYGPIYGSETVGGTRRFAAPLPAYQDSSAARIAYTDGGFNVAGEIRTRNVSPLACIRYK